VKKNAVGEAHRIMHHMGYGVKFFLKFLMLDTLREQSEFVIG
jgi:hypothetical protein